MIYVIMLSMDYHDYIWDLGGTLLDNYELSTQAFLATLADFGVTAQHDEVYAQLKNSTAEAVAYFMSGSSDFLQAYKRKEKVALSEPILFYGAREVLFKIQQSGSRNFLISHRDNHVLELLEKLNIREYFTEVVTSNNGFERKPSPESFLYLKEKYMISQALVIGDREIDKIAGESAGFSTLLVDGKHSLLQIIR